MKTLQCYIMEAIKSNDLVKLTMSTKHIAFINKLEKALNKISNDKLYSLGNKQDVKKLFKLFIEKMGFHTEIEARKMLRDYGIYDEDTFAKWMILNASFLKDHKYKINFIKDFNETELDKKYNAWRHSPDYVEGKPFDKDNFDEDDEDDVRKMVVYDANDPANPDTLLEFPLKGKVGKDTQDQITNFKMDWRRKTGLEYYDARPILAQNYIKLGKDKLEKYIYFSNDDLTEL